MTRLLASVTSVQEAQMALAGGADIIDLKNPGEGALGALPLAAIKQIVGSVAGHRPVSATIGDLPMQPELLARSVRATVETGVDIVKVGFFGRAGCEACIQGLEPLAKDGVCIVAVLMADQSPDFSLLSALAEAGFYGVMLDTANKTGRRLTDYFYLTDLEDFVIAAHALGLQAGLAGSLRQTDVVPLAQLGPDYLGFRGALCENHSRAASMNADSVRQLKLLLRNYNKSTALPH